MSIEKIGKSGEGHTFWKFAPNMPGTNVEMAVGIVATAKGLQVGCGTITWEELDVARSEFT